MEPQQQLQPNPAPVAPQPQRPYIAPQSKSNKALIITLVSVAGAIVILGVVITILLVNRSHDKQSASSTTQSPSSTQPSTSSDTLNSEQQALLEPQTYTDSAKIVSVRPPKGWVQGKRADGILSFYIKDNASSRATSSSGFFFVGKPALNNGQYSSIDSYVTDLKASLQKAKPNLAWQSTSGQKMTVDGLPAVVLRFIITDNSAQTYYTLMSLLKNDEFFSVHAAVDIAKWPTISASVDAALQTLRVL